VEASEFRDAKKQFEKRKVEIFGVSADSVQALARFKEKYKFNFTLLSDPDHKMIEAYGFWRMKKFMGRSYKGIVRSSVLIGSDGAVEKVWDSVTAKGHAAEILQFLETPK
jgi:thioredoxin-dependent peroxiredoxin